MANDVFITQGGSDVIDRVDGLVLLSFFIIFMYYTFGISKAKGKGEEIETKPMGKSIILLSVGLVALFLGGKWTVDGAMAIAQHFAISDAVIGLTVVAVGTSLPELVTSIVAALKKQTDIAIGNAVGSNIFNVFWVLGLSSTIRPLPFTTENTLDVLFAIAAAFVLFLVMFVGKRHTLYKWEGTLFVALYVGYTAFRVMTG
jgi:cation:H+ antiporter